jgi:hypothetical protein
MIEDVELIHTKVSCTGGLCAYYTDVRNHRLVFDSIGMEFMLSIYMDIYAYECIG